MINHNAPKVHRRKQRGKIAPRTLVKCAYCGERLEIYDLECCLEINGVLATKQEWREILLPLLETTHAE